MTNGKDTEHLTNGKDAEHLTNGKDSGHLTSGMGAGLAASGMDAGLGDSSHCFLSVMTTISGGMPKRKGMRAPMPTVTLRHRLPCW